MNATLDLPSLASAYRELTPDARHTLDILRVVLPFDVGAIVDVDDHGRPVVVASPVWERMAPLARALCAKGLHFSCEQGANGDPLVIVQA